eukprot:TRINITY_DN623_c0_g1_i6.p1 TRINITY_DN623_c0_g1~~TRINITY_DN623_c0_g1_i6.p1  ORF type:complete len:470 (-),score=189.73 TRINITY_DN623_c0_g1_i6:55-1464(-)
MFAEPENKAEDEQNGWGGDLDVDMFAEPEKKEEDEQNGNDLNVDMFAEPEKKVEDEQNGNDLNVDMFAEPEKKEEDEQNGWGGDDLDVDMFAEPEKKVEDEQNGWGGDLDVDMFAEPEKKVEDEQNGWGGDLDVDMFAEPEKKEEDEQNGWGGDDLDVDMFAEPEKKEEDEQNGNDLNVDMFAEPDGDDLNVDFFNSPDHDPEDEGWGDATVHVETPSLTSPVVEETPSLDMDFEWGSGPTGVTNDTPQSPSTTSPLSALLKTNAETPQTTTQEADPYDKFLTPQPVKPPAATATSSGTLSTGGARKKHRKRDGRGLASFASTYVDKGPQTFSFTDNDDDSSTPDESKSNSNKKSESSKKQDKNNPRRTSTRTQPKKELAECPICSKSFALDVIEVHAASCTGESEPPSMSTAQYQQQQHQLMQAMAMMNAMSAGGSRPSQSSNLVPCPLCGRKFSATAIQIHAENCGT